MSGAKTDLQNPIYHDDEAARAHLRAHPVAARAGLSALRQLRSEARHADAGQVHTPRPLQVQRVPQAVHGHGRHSDGALENSAVQVGSRRSTHVVEQEGF